MPEPKIRPGGFILKCPGEEDRLINVHATSHKAAYFKFQKGSFGPSVASPDRSNESDPPRQG
jgi:hypothetical protein